MWLFFQRLKQKYGCSWPDDPKKQLQLTAIHFNGGLHLQEEDLDRIAAARWFPYGPRFPGKQYSFVKLTEFAFEHISASK